MLPRTRSNHMDACPFCDRSTVEGRIIAETGLMMAFPTNIPITPGHTLIVPKRHAATFDDLSLQEKISLEQMRGAIVGALAKTMGAQGFNYAWNEGAVAGQSVPHFHLHIVPRTAGDAGVLGYEPREFLYRPGSRNESPEAELAEVAQQLREAL